MFTYSVFRTVRKERLCYKTKALQIPMDRILVFKHIRDINEYIKMPLEAQALIEETVNKILDDPDFDKKCTGLTAYFFATHDNRRELVHDLAKEKGVDGDLLCLVMCELYSIETKNMYIRNGWPMSVYYDSLLDLNIWAHTCLEKTGKWGLLEYGWIALALFGVIFRLGRLQFELVDCNENALPLTLGGINIRKGCRAINIHIPEGDGITKEKRMDSYRQAYKFFNQTGYAVFMCHSWLLYPKHREFLPENSNILSFMDDFNLFSMYEGNGEMHRVFGSAWPPADNNYDLLPQKTSIQRAFLNRIKNGGTAGGALGFFVFDGENIVS